MPDLARALLLSWAVRGLFLLLVPPGARSADLQGWISVAVALVNGANPYVVTTSLNWPPLWMQCLFAMAKVSMWTGVDFLRLVQCFLLLVESGVVVLVYHLLPRGEESCHRLRLIVCGVSLNPVAVLLVCQHGNFDVLLAFWVLLALAGLAAFHRSRSETDLLGSCLSLGMGVLTKTVPLVLSVLLVPFARRASGRTRLLGLLLLLGPAALGMSVIYSLSPGAVTRNVLGYRSSPGWFGVTGILSGLGLGSMTQAYSTFFAWGCLAGLAALGAVLWRAEWCEPRACVLLGAMLLTGLVVLGPGYGPQYLYWLLPPLIVVYGSYPVRRLRVSLNALYVVAALTCVIEYGLIPSHGAFLRHLWPADATLAYWGTCVSSPAGATALRLPLFGALAWVLVAGCTTLAGLERASRPTPAEPAS